MTKTSPKITSATAAAPSPRVNVPEIQLTIAIEPSADATPTATAKRTYLTTDPAILALPRSLFQSYMATRAPSAPIGPRHSMNDPRL